VIRSLLDQKLVVRDGDRWRATREISNIAIPDTLAGVITARLDRLDEEALRKELEGVAGTDLVYVVKEGGQEVVGLSKTGVDECCLALVAQGQVIREEDMQYEVIGAGEDREALFKVKAARFAVSPAGQEVRLDQVIGVMVVIVLIGLLADKLLFSPWERFLHRRWGTGLK